MTEIFCDYRSQRPALALKNLCTWVDVGTMRPTSGHKSLPLETLSILAIQLSKQYITLLCAVIADYFVRNERKSIKLQTTDHLRW